MLFMPKNLGPGIESYNLLTDAGALLAAERISGLASFAGMVITLPQGGSARLKDMADVARLLRGLFGVLKAFLQSADRKFVVLIHSREDAPTLGGLLAEGMLGLFLCAAQENPSVQFRTLAIGPDNNLRAGFDGALDRGYHHSGDDSSGWQGLHFRGARLPVGLQWSGKSAPEPWRRDRHVRGRRGYHCPTWPAAWRPSGPAWSFSGGRRFPQASIPPSRSLNLHRLRRSPPTTGPWR